MSRSQQVRQEALRLDGERCQITGAAAKDGKQLEVHHVRPLGMGGSDELDVVENCITLEAQIHVWVECGALKIAEWEREYHGYIYDDENDETHELGTDGGLEVIDNQNVLGHGIGRVDHKHLWFYRRRHVEELEQAETRVQAFAMADKTIAADLWALKNEKAWKELEPTASSFAQYCASRGLDARRSSMMASLYGEHGDGWPEDVSAADYRRTLPKDAKLQQQYVFGKIVGIDSALVDMLRIIVANAVKQPDASMGGATDCYAVPLGDIEDANKLLDIKIGGPVQYIVEFTHSRDEDGLREGLSETEGLFRVGKFCARGPYMREAE
jgi:hypothetical protein